jgi:hypothetical protein
MNQIFSYRFCEYEAIWHEKIKGKQFPSNERDLEQ